MVKHKAAKNPTLDPQGDAKMLRLFEDFQLRLAPLLQKFGISVNIDLLCRQVCFIVVQIRTMGRDEMHKSPETNVVASTGHHQ
jgi:hypothetical protein